MYVCLYVVGTEGDDERLCVEDGACSETTGVDMFSVENVN